MVSTRYFEIAIYLLFKKLDFQTKMNKHRFISG